ncbi:hypothetical protein CTI14_66595, partial [Methylobacterium radiotolerans]
EAGNVGVTSVTISQAAYQGSTRGTPSTTRVTLKASLVADLTAPTALTAKAYDEAGNVGVTSVTISQAAYQGSTRGTPSTTRVTL